MNASIRCWCQYPPRMNNQHHGNQKERIFGGSNLHNKYLYLDLKIEHHQRKSFAYNIKISTIKDGVVGQLLLASSTIGTFLVI